MDQSYKNNLLHITTPTLPVSSISAVLILGPMGACVLVCVCVWGGLHVGVCVSVCVCVFACVPREWELVHQNHTLVDNQPEQLRKTS